MTFLQTPKTALDFVNMFAQPVTSMGISDRVPKVKIVIAIKELAKFVDLDKVSSLISELKDNELTGEERLQKARFRKAKAMLDKGIDPQSPIAMMNDDDEKEP